MAKRVQLNEEQVEKVVGGAFNFYTNKKGQQRCVVDDVGTYYVTPNAMMWVIERTAGSDDSSAVVTQEALDLGYFSVTPL